MWTDSDEQKEEDVQGWEGIRKTKKEGGGKRKNGTIINEENVYW